jgi:hypothetical protein
LSTLAVDTLFWVKMLKALKMRTLTLLGGLGGIELLSAASLFVGGYLAADSFDLILRHINCPLAISDEVPISKRPEVANFLDALVTQGKFARVSSHMCRVETA